MSDENSARVKTWESIKRHPEIERWVRSDSGFQRLLKELVQNFGAIEVSPPDDSKVFPWIREEIKKGGRR